MAYDLVIHGMDYQYMRKHEQISKIFCQVTAASHERLRVTCVCVCVCVCAQSWLTLCNPVGCSPACSSIHGIFQARILELISFPPPWDFPDPGIKSMSFASPALAGRSFTTAPPGKPYMSHHFTYTEVLGKTKLQRQKLNLGQLEAEREWRLTINEHKAIQSDSKHLCCVVVIAAQLCKCAQADLCI